MSTSKKQTAKLNTKQLVQLAVLMAITIIMGTTPLGTIRTGFMSVSLVSVPVAVAAITLGIPGGILCGGVFGITSFINAVTGTSGMMTILFGVNPYATLFTTIVPRVLEGLLVALIFDLFHNKLSIKKISHYIAALCCPLLNTLLFMTCIVIFFYNSDYIQELVAKLGATNPLIFVITLVGVQAIAEAVTCLILGGTVSLVIEKIENRS